MRTKTLLLTSQKIKMIQKMKSKLTTLSLWNCFQSCRMSRKVPPNSKYRKICSTELISTRSKSTPTKCTNINLTSIHTLKFPITALNSISIKRQCLVILSIMSLLAFNWTPASNCISKTKWCLIIWASNHWCQTCQHKLKITPLRITSCLSPHNNSNSKWLCNSYK